MCLCMYTGIIILCFLHDIPGGNIIRIESKHQLEVGFNAVMSELD